jgi:hypothetical protein
MKKWIKNNKDVLDMIIPIILIIIILESIGTTRRDKQQNEVVIVKKGAEIDTIITIKKHKKGIGNEHYNPTQGNPILDPAFSGLPENIHNYGGY